MEIQVIIENVHGNGFRATGAGGISIGLTAEGATSAEAMDRIKGLIQERLNAGAKLTQVKVASEQEHLKEDAGWLRDEPLYEAWRQAMAEYRSQLDEDPEAL